MSTQSIVSIIYIVLLITAFSLEQFHIVPLGTAAVIMGLVTGHAVGANITVGSGAGGGPKRPTLDVYSWMDKEMSAPPIVKKPTTDERG